MTARHIKTFVALLRCRHWLKNVLVLLPAIFGGVLVADPAATAGAALGFAAFCCLSSAVYILNDLRDAERDRLHPTKRLRPIASGEVSPAVARACCAILIAAACALNALATHANLPQTFVCLAAYLALNVAYSLGLKRVAVLDVAILASGFFLRVLYGSFATGVAMFSWLFLTVIALSFYMALGKRQGELRAQAGGGTPQTREVLGSYTPEFLASNMTVFMALGLAFYSLWAVGAGKASAPVPDAEFTIPLVFVICLRYSLLASRGDHDADPVELVLADRVLLALVAACLLTLGVLVYL